MRLFSKYLKKNEEVKVKLPLTLSSCNLKIMKGGEAEDILKGYQPP